MKTTNMEIYCDGSCRGNPGPTGIGLAVYRNGRVDDLWYGLFSHQGTSSKAELQALHYSLKLAESEIAKGYTINIYSDSEYAIGCITKWAFGWHKKKWERKDPIKNLEVIKQAFALYKKISTHVRVSHVKAHRGIEGNELADRLANIAVRRFEREMEPYTESITGLLQYR